MTRGRRIFDIFAGATLVGFIAFTAAILLCAATLPSFRTVPKTGVERMLENGWTIVGVSYSDPRFTADGRTLFYRRSTRLTLDKDERSYDQTDREIVTPSEVRPGAALSAPLLARLLGMAAGAELPEFAVAVAPGRGDIAFATGGDGGAVFHADAKGEWRAVAGSSPPWAAALGAKSGSPEELMASADRLDWIAGAIAAHQAGRFEPSMIVERALRIRTSEPGRLRELAELLIEIDHPGKIAETARFATAPGIDPALQKVLLDGVDREALLPVLVGREWGDSPGDLLKEWALSPLEKGDFASFDEAAQRAILAKLALVAGPVHAPRLAKVLETNDGLAGAAACLALRRIAGEPVHAILDVSLVAPGRAWLAELRKRRADLFP